MYAMKEFTDAYHGNEILKLLKKIANNNWRDNDSFHYPIPLYTATSR